MERFFGYIMARIYYVRLNDNDVCFVLDQQSYRVSSLKRESTNIHAAHHGHLILILNQPISVNSYSVILRSQQIPILKSLVYPDPGIELTNFLARGKHDNHYTDDYCCSII